jgi:hypothetical protein
VQAVVLVFAFTSIYFTGVILPRANPNELSRIEAAVAIVDEGTLSIDGAIARLGNHEDKASGDGRFHSNKAPGLTLALVPLYAALRLLFPPPTVARHGCS